MATAIVPPDQNLQPIEPGLAFNTPSNKPFAPVTQIDLPEPDVTPSGRYESAVKTNDPRPLVQLAQENKGTEVGQHSAEAAKTIIKNTAQFDEMTRDINPNTEQGRLALANSFQKVSDREQAKRLGWQSVDDNPDWGKALMYFAAGDKKTAMDFVVGGQYKPVIEYNDQGKPLVKMVNSVGNFYVRDPITNRVISEKEYYEGGGSRPLEDTLARKKQIQEQEQYVKKNMEAVERNNDTQTAYTAIAPLVNQKNQIWGELYQSGEFTKPQLDRIASMSNGSVTSARSYSNNFQALEDAVKGEGIDINASNEKSVSGALKELGKASGVGELSIGADGKVYDANKKSYNSKELRQLMQTNSVGAQLDRTFNQTKADLKNQLLAANVSPELYNKIMSAIDIDSQIEQVRAGLIKKHGALPTFVIPALASSVGDAAVRPQIQAVQELFNVDMVNKFQDWSRNEIARNKEIDKNYVPKPGELEAAFTRTKIYQGAAAEAAERAKQIRDRPYREAVPTNKQEQQAAETINIGGVGEKELKAIPKAVAPPAAPIKTTRAESAVAEKERRRQKATEIFGGK